VSFTVFELSVKRSLDSIPVRLCAIVSHTLLREHFKMAYIKRDEQGNIVSVSKTETDSTDEYLAVESPELIAHFLNSESKEEVKEALSVTDSDLVRVLEDLIYTLIDKKLILFTDLPQSAQEKLVNRDKIRGQLTSLSNLMSDDEALL
jgi:hypothetical protein